MFLDRTFRIFWFGDISILEVYQLNQQILPLPFSSEDILFQFSVCKFSAMWGYTSIKGTRLNGAWDTRDS